jgi:hypothetical protein
MDLERKREGGKPALRRKAINFFHDFKPLTAHSALLTDHFACVYQPANPIPRIAPLRNLICQSREAKPFTRHTIPESFLAITAFFAFSIQVTPV